MESLEYKIVLDVVNAEAQIDNLNQKLSGVSKEIDTINSKGLDSLGKAAKKAAKEIDNLNKTVDKTTEAVDKAKAASQAWGAAFSDVMLNAASSLDVASPGFRELVSQVRGAIPIVKSLNLTAVKGLKGVKAAIASTGIGLLIIAVGELAANWSKVTSVVKDFMGEANWDKLTEGLSKFWDKAKEGFAWLFRQLAALSYTVNNGFSNFFAAVKKALKGDFQDAWDTIKDNFNFKQNWEEGLELGEAALQGLADFQERNRREQAQAAIAEARKLNETRREAIEREHSERMANLDAEYKKGKFNAEEYAKIKAEYDKKYRSDVASLRQQTTVTTTTPQASTQDVKDFQTLTKELGRIAEEQLSKISDKAKEAYTNLVSVWQIGEDNKDNNGFISAEDALRDINTLIEAGLIKTQNWEGLVKSLADGEQMQVDHLNAIQSSQTAILKAQRDVTESKVVQLGLDKQIAESEIKQQENVIQAIKEQINIYNKFNDDNKFTEQIFQLSTSLEEATAKLEVLKAQAANIGTKDLKSLVSSLMPKEDEATQLRKSLADIYSLLDYYREQDLVSEIEYNRLKLQARDNFLQALNDLEARAREERAKAQEEEAEEEVDKYQVSLGAAQDAIDDILSIGDGLSSKWGDAFAVLHRGLNQITVDFKSGKKDWTTWANGAASAIGFVSQITQALADQEDASTKEGFEKQKKLQRASVILSGIQGSVAAVTNAIRDFGTPVGVLVGGALSAAIIALTKAQVAAIDRTTFEGGGSLASVTPVVAGIDENLPTQTVVTNQQDQRVYILESDIQSSNKRVKVREGNTTF